MNKKKMNNNFNQKMKNKFNNYFNKPKETL